MKMHRLVVYVVDFNDSGISDICSLIEEVHGAKVEEADTTDIGEWSDDHELNRSHCGSEITHAKYFREKEANEHRIRS